MRLTMAVLLISIFVLQGVSRSAIAQTPIDDCDRLAAVGTDVNRAAPGVRDEVFDAEQALPACQRAVRFDPASRRLRFQLARALTRGGKPEEAAPLLAPLAQAGYASAAVELALLLGEGRGVPQDAAKAQSLIDEAAELGEAKAQNEVGLRYFRGAGAPQDYVKARALFEKSAAQGFVLAQFNLGLIFELGLGTPAESGKAIELYELSGEQGFAPAQYRLAQYYQTGPRIDFAKARALLEKAAAAGDSFAKANLGSLYREGSGVPRNAALAAKWIQASADDGNPLGLLHLAKLHQRGEGVARDELAAYALYRLALAAGNQDALLPLAELVSSPLSTVSLDKDLWTGFDSAVEASLAETPALPDFLDGPLRARFVQLREKRRQPTGSGSKDSEKTRQQEMEVLNDYALAFALSRNALLSKNAAIVVEGLKASKGEALLQAAAWLGAAWENGNTDAALMLANLHLAETGFTRTTFPWSSRFARQTPIGPTFVAKASEAARLYRDAIAKGSLAARINLAALHEAGHGVERDARKARSLYEQSLGTRFDGPARVGLLRLDFAPQWALERSRIDRAFAAVNDTGGDDRDSIVISGNTDLAGLDVIDAQGRRFFSGSLPRGASYRVPRGRTDLFLSLQYGSVVLTYNGTQFDLPHTGRSSLIRLDPEALARKAAVVPVDREHGSQEWTLPPETLVKSRVLLEARSRTVVHVSSDDSVLGYEKELAEDDQVRIPDVRDLFLNIRSPGDEAKQPGSVVLHIDQVSRIDLGVPKGCLAHVDLDADALPTATVVAGPPPDCGQLAPEERRALLVAANGRVLGTLQRQPDEQVEGVVAGFLRLNRSLAVLRLTLGQRWDEALRVQQIFRAQDLREHGPNSFEAIDSAIGLAEVETRMGQPEPARAVLEDALERLGTFGRIPVDLQIRFHRQFGSVLLALGRYAEAERSFLVQYALQAEKDRAAGLPAAKVASASLDNLRVATLRLGRLEPAIGSLLQQLLIEKLEAPERKEAFTSEVGAGNLTVLIDLLQRTGRQRQAKELLGYAHQQAKREIARDIPEPFTFPLDLSVFEQTFGPVDQSELLAGALATLGKVYSWSGRHAEALPLFEQQLRTRSKIHGPVSAQSAEAMARVAREAAAVGDPDRATRLAREAVSSIATYYAQRSSSRQAAAASADALKPAVAILLQLLEDHSPKPGDGAPEAFETAQRLQSSSAALALQALGKRLSQSDPEVRAFVRQRQDLETELVTLDAALVSSIANRIQTGDAGPEHNARGRIRKIEELLQALDATRPAKLAKLEAVNLVSTVSYPEVKALLQADEALVNIVPGDEETFVFVATPAMLRWSRIPIGVQQIETAVATLRCGLDREQWRNVDSLERCRQLTGIQFAGDLLPFDLALGHKLYGLLLGPFDEVIADKHLLLSLSGPLAALPPQVLVTRAPPSGRAATAADYRATPWLGRRNAITVLPSVASLASLRSAAAPAGDRATEAYIGLGNPKLEGDGCPTAAVPASCAAMKQPLMASRGGTAAIDSGRRVFRGGLADVTALRQMCPLPETTLELGCVAESLEQKPGLLLVGEDLTESAVKKLPLDRYRIIHFATHGLLADESRALAGPDAEPALVMTPPTVATAEDDGLLTASEIAALKLNADWVVLSACNTAGGGQMGSEALSGLARAFFHAGARTLLVSHWAVDSAATVRLITQTFSAISSNPALGPAEALKQSMVQLMDDDSLAHPQAWAPFVVIGEGAARFR